MHRTRQKCPSGTLAVGDVEIGQGLQQPMHQQTPLERDTAVIAQWRAGSRFRQGGTRRRKRARRFRFFRRRRVGPVGKVRNMGDGNVVALFSVWFAGLRRFQPQPFTLPSKMRVVIRPAGVGLERERLGHRFQSPRYDVPPRRIGRGAAGAVSGDIEPVLGARHGNIEKTPVFLVLAVALLGGKPLGGTFAYPRPGGPQQNLGILSAPSANTIPH